MDLILWRHAEAEDGEPGEPDARRKLTTKGQKQARRMAEWLDAQLPETTDILVSPALRTQQTVEALDRRFKTVNEIASGCEPEAVLKAANWPSARKPVLVVGHQPTLGQVAALLLTGSPQYWNIKKGNVWWISQRDPDDPDSIYLKAVMGPDLILKP
jgi:phosphohistidine phosphatase